MSAKNTATAKAARREERDQRKGGGKAVVAANAKAATAGPGRKSRLRAFDAAAKAAVEHQKAAKKGGKGKGGKCDPAPAGE